MQDRFTKHYSLKLEGRLFESQYGVFVIEIQHPSGVYYYIDQTAHDKKITSYSPIASWAHHIAPIPNIEKQCLVLLKKHLQIKSQKEFEQWLGQSTIHLHFYKSENFIFEKETLTNRRIHHEKRRRVLALAKALMEIGAEHNKKILNSNYLSYKNTQDYQKEAAKIWDQLSDQGTGS